MKKIEVEILNIEEYLKIKEKDFINQYFRKRNYLYVLILLVCGLIFFVAGTSSGYDFKSEALRKGIEKVNYYNYHFHIGIGVALIFFALLKGINLFKAKNINKKSFSIVFKQLIELNSSIKFVIDDEKIEYLTEFSEIKRKWNYFGSYVIEKENIKLYENNHYIKHSEYIIPLEGMKIDEKQFIADLLKKKLKRLK